jgi:drug/metabolite transporter (DMT)-like permease
MKEKQHAPARSLLILAFFAIYIIWGTTYVAVLFGLEGFPPFLMSGFRFTLAGVILLAWCIVKKKKLPAGRDLRIAGISGIVMLVGGSGLVTWSEQFIASGHAAIITATEPFLFLLLDRKKWAFYFSQPNILAGLVLGFAGIILFFSFAQQPAEQTTPAHLHFIAFLVLIIAAVLWVVGSLYSKQKKDPDVANTATTALQLIAAGIFSFILALVFRETAGFSLQQVSLRAWGGLLYLTFLGSIMAYLAFTWLLTVRPAAQVSTHTYVNPVVAVFVGWWIADEPVGLLQVIGLLVIIAGVVLTNKPVRVNKMQLTGLEVLNDGADQALMADK